VSASYLLRRTVTILVTVLIVSVLVFGITQVLPADAAVMLLGENATPEQLVAVRARLGLDLPVWQQYLGWVGHVLRGDFGTSLESGLPVGEVMFTALGRSLLLALLSLVLMLVVAIPLGVVAALRRGRASDFGIGLASYVGVSMPEFVTATLVLITLGNPAFGLLPSTGYLPLTEDFWGGLARLVLPVLTVSVVLMAHVVRMVRSEMVDVLGTDYVRAARMKGLSRPRILFRHALRNALLPTITVVALDIGYLLGGIIVVEEIFAFPGIGRALIVAIQQRDLPSIQAGALIMAATYALANLLADLAYAALDKRIRYA
jgi:peptide/nickel transport system permease protein